MAAARRPWYQTRKWGGTLLLVYAIVFALFGILAWGVYSHPVLAPDVTITHLFQANQSPWLRITMIAVSTIGDVQFLSAGLLALAAVIFWLVDLRLEAIMIVVVTVTSDILDALIKSLVARPRPTAHLVDIISAATGNSFPSGHVLRSILGAAVLFRTHPLQGAPLVAHHPAGSLRTACNPGWPFARLPGSPLDKRCPGCLLVGWCLSGYLVVDLSLSKRERGACSKTRQNRASS